MFSALPCHGLSPRARGNLYRLEKELGRPRSIPACAGEPLSDRPATFGSTVYPRVRGGTPAAPVSMGPGLGLSPRARGNQPSRGLHAGLPRSIPACAGEPRGRRTAIAESRVYPRVRGGTGPPWRTAIRCGGLSPRARGNPTSFGVVAPNSGSIPACAGEPITSKDIGFRVKVYPRVRGGTRIAFLSEVSDMGLSPRARGNRQQVQRRPAIGGSIPACAGEPPAPRYAARLRRVYPRVRGGTGERRRLSVRRAATVGEARRQGSWAASRELR